MDRTHGVLADVLLGIGFQTYLSVKGTLYTCIKIEFATESDGWCQSSGVLRFMF
jgi:hypothetical protein